MSYSNPERGMYVFPNVDYGAGTTTHAIPVPTGKRGRLIDIQLAATESFNSVTTDGSTSIGISGTISRNALFVQGDLAAGAAISAKNLSDPDWLVEPEIVKDSVLLVTCTAPTGGTPAGIATVTVIIDWQD